MKTPIFLITVALLTTAALPISTVSENASDHLAQQIVAALKKGSAEDYIKLLPTLAEFHGIMDNNASVYGEYLIEAKEEFAARYENKIIPSVKKSFISVLEEGDRRGINWSQIYLESVECTTDAKDLKPVPFTIVFSTNGREYRMTIDKAFIMHDVWKVSSEISLI